MEPPAVRCLITGAAGFVGPHLVDHLQACGDAVTAIDQGNGPDLRDHEAWAKLVSEDNPDVIFHLAGWSDVGGSWQDPVTTYQVNTMGTVGILEAARASGQTRVILVSSADVYGLVMRSQLPISELTAASPRSPYGASKVAAETAAQAYWEGFGLEVIIARPFNHLGPGQSPRFIAPALALQIAKAEQTGGGAVAHGDLTPERDFTDVRDVVRAYRCLGVDGEPGQIYNICSGRAVAISKLFAILSESATVPIKGRVDHSLLRPVELPVLQGSFAKLHAATGWSPTIELTTSLDDVLIDARCRAKESDVH